MLPHYGMFFIFISGMAYISAFLTAVLMSLKTYTINVSIFSGLLIHHLFFVVGLYLSWDVIRAQNFNIVQIFKMALNLSVQSIQFLLILNGIFLAFNFMQGVSVHHPRGLYEVIHFLTYLALFFHFRKKRVI